MKSDMTIAKGIILGFLIAACMAFTYTLDYAVPVGTQAPSVLDDYARNDKSAFIERLNVDHFFSLTGTQVSDAATGQHRQIEFYGPITKPTAATNKSWLYAKDVSDKAELHWEDEDGDEVQLTSGGVFNIGLLTSTTITTPTLTSPVFNTGVSGTAVLDEDDLSSDSATQIATQQSIKAYIDAGRPAYSGGQSYTFPGGLIIKAGKTSQPSGDVVSSGTVTVTFGTAFPNGIVSVTGTIINAESSATVVLQVRSASKTAVIFDYDEWAAVVQSCGGIYWTAIGS